MAGQQPGVRGGAALRAGVAALVALLPGVARAQDVDGGDGLVGEDAPAPPADSVEEPGWPFESDAELAAWARQAGTRLAATRFTWTTLGEWSRLASPLGLQYHDGGRTPSSGFHELWLGHGYGIPLDGASAQGWSAHPMLEESRSIDPDSSLEVHVLPAWRPSVEVLGPGGWKSELPAREDLPGKILAVSPGNGRLVLVDLSPGGSARLLPLEHGAVDPGLHGLHRPWGWPNVAADNLRKFGRLLAAPAEDADTLTALELVSRELGFRIRQRGASRANATSGYSSPGLWPTPFRHGAAVLPDPHVDTGMRVYFGADADEEHPAQLVMPMPTEFLPFDAPSITFITRRRCSAQRPPDDELADADILVTTGNGVLLQIGMGPAGVVTLWPFP